MTSTPNHNQHSQRERPSALTLTYGVTACLALWLYFLIPGQVGQPVTLFGAAPEGLAPDVMPRLVLLCLAAIAAVGAVTAYRDDATRLSMPGRTVIVTSLASFAFAAVLVPLGFVIASAVTVVLLAVFLGGRHPVGLALSSVIVPVGIYLIFTRVLHIALPAGLAGI